MIKINQDVFTLDLHFQSLPRTIAVYLLPHEHGAALIECGPGSTIPALLTELQTHGFQAGDITDIFLTHIHLDHAGSAGWWSLQGARIHVHPAGASHLIDPEKLLSSAQRIYGDMMNTLWGEFLPVPEDQLNVLHDGDTIDVYGLKVRAIDTPGHAYHHFVYICRGVCFSGDIGGVRLAGTPHVRLPMPPPEFHLETWRESLKKLQSEFESGSFTRIAPTHFGIYEDAGWYLAALQAELDAVQSWIEAIMPKDPPVEELNNELITWTKERAFQKGVPKELLDSYEAANPTWMSPYGIQRYWRKYRQPKIPGTAI
jgi:glyoxylase-like metal-dependent hydrolase (beta-lactamase superfamily II)